LLASAVDLLHWSREFRIDHIHSHSCANSAHIVAMARYLGGPTYSLTLHGDLNVYGKNQQFKMEKAEFICAVGSHLRQQILDRTSVPEPRIHVTCMGVATAEMAALGKDREFKTGTLHLATVARLHPNKGHMHALEAVFRARQAGINVTYTIAGEGSYRDKIVSRIEQLGLTDCVRLTGTVGEAEVFRILSSADAYLLPSVKEGEAWPVSVMEAMSAGLPVVASDIGATPEMINSGFDGIIVPQADEAALLQSILFLANNVQSRREIGHAARITAQSRFDVRVTAKSLIETIHRAKIESADRASWS